MRRFIEGEICSKCDKNEGMPLHTCPFLSDVHENNQFKCNCCDECRQNCVDDI